VTGFGQPTPYCDDHQVKPDEIERKDDSAAMARDKAEDGTPGDTIDNVFTRRV
jgi:hypothetical protein